MRIVDAMHLKIDMKLGKHVFDTNGAILLTKGTILTESYIVSLRDKKIPAVYIDDEISEGVEIKDVIDGELKIKAMETVKDIFDAISSEKRQMKRTGFIPDEAYKDVRNIIQLIIDNIQKNKTTLYNMVEMMSTDLATYTHCVNVAVLAILTGRGLGYDEKQLVELGTGGLLIDLGMTQVPTEIINKPGVLSEEEFQLIKKHPIYGYEMVKSNRTISAFIKTMILMHHERLDGSGYPMGLKGDQINPYVRIISICDMFQAMITDRAYRKRMPIYKALELISAQTIDKLDVKIYEEFVKNIAIYPIGTGVVLNTGDRGLVIENHKNFPTRPRIRIIFKEDGSYYPGFRLVDLMKERTLFIDDTCDIYK